MPCNHVEKIAYHALFGPRRDTTCVVQEKEILLHFIGSKNLLYGVPRRVSGVSWFRLQLDTVVTVILIGKCLGFAMQLVDVISFCNDFMFLLFTLSFLLFPLSCSSLIFQRTLMDDSHIDLNLLTKINLFSAFLA